MTERRQPPSTLGGGGMAISGERLIGEVVYRLPDRLSAGGIGCIGLPPWICSCSCWSCDSCEPPPLAVDVDAILPLSFISSLPELWISFIQSITLIPDSAIYRNSCIPDREFQSLEKAYSMFCTAWLFGYTGFFVYRTQNLSPNQSGIRAIDCMWKNWIIKLGGGGGTTKQNTWNYDQKSIYGKQARWMVLLYCLPAAGAKL